MKLVANFGADQSSSFASSRRVGEFEVGPCNKVKRAATGRSLGFGLFLASFRSIPDRTSVYANA